MTNSVYVGHSLERSRAYNFPRKRHFHRGKQVMNRVARSCPLGHSYLFLSTIAYVSIMCWAKINHHLTDNPKRESYATPTVRSDILNIVKLEGPMLKFASPIVLLLAICLLSSSCSVFMVAGRASYKGDINVIQVGVQRSVVVAELGQPDNFTTLDNGGYDDRYVLDPNAHRGGMKFLTGLFYLVADIFTAFLTELIFTPSEIAMKDKFVVYHLIYDANGTLSTIEKLTP